MPPLQAGARQIVGRDLVKTELAHTVMETAAANAMKLVRLVAAPSQARIPLYKDIDANQGGAGQGVGAVAAAGRHPQGNHAAGAG